MAVGTEYPMAAPLIAVIDDDAMLRDLLHEVLSDEGYRTLLLSETTGIAEALHQARPRLILLDIRLEDRETGWRVLEELRRDTVTAHLPVIICSADRRCLQERADYLAHLGYVALEKPFDLDDLLAQVRDCLSRPSEPAILP